MINDRDLLILGTGALLAVFCLLLPYPFWVKGVTGLSVLVIGIILAFLRLGPDRIPFEAWFYRLIRYSLNTHRYTYQQSGWRLPHRRRKWFEVLWSRASSSVGHEEEISSIASDKDQAVPLIFIFKSFSLVPISVAAYPLTTVCLAVLSIYFIAWLAQGGGESLARWFS